VSLANATDDVSRSSDSVATQVAKNRGAKDTEVTKRILLLLTEPKLGVTEGGNSYERNSKTYWVEAINLHIPA